VAGGDEALDDDVDAAVDEDVEGDCVVGEGRPRQPQTSTADSARPTEMASGVRSPADRLVIFPLW